MKYILYVCFVFLFACSSATKQYHPRTEQAINQAQKQGFVLKRYHTNPFLITTYEHITHQDETKIHIYIEGDGNSWKTRYQLSDNPTPHQPLALKLAMKDDHNAVYIARPCQYTPLNLDKHCESKYWSSHRYAPEVIESTSEVLDKIKTAHPHTTFVLIGFSGGASVAALLAAQREDVVGLISVAGDLNHELLNQHHHTTPLNHSLNPSKVAHKLRKLPQHHLVGDNDKIVPSFLAHHFAKQVNNPACVQISTLKGVSHHKGWEKEWKNILDKPLTCS